MNDVTPNTTLAEMWTDMTSNVPALTENIPLKALFCGGAVAALTIVSVAAVAAFKASGDAGPKAEETFNRLIYEADEFIKLGLQSAP